MKWFDLFGNRGYRINAMLERGAVVVDVRTPQEYAGGHVKNSINIPLDTLSKHVTRIQQMKKPVITCCASGMRSGVAANQLKKHQIDVVNGGSWATVNKHV